MTVTYITRDGTKIDGTTGQDHLLEVIYGHALTRIDEDGGNQDSS